MWRAGALLTLNDVEGLLLERVHANAVDRLLNTRAAHHIIAVHNDIWEGVAPAGSVGRHIDLWHDPNTCHRERQASVVEWQQLEGCDPKLLLPPPYLGLWRGVQWSPHRWNCRRAVVPAPQAVPGMAVTAAAA